MPPTAKPQRLATMSPHKSSGGWCLQYFSVNGVSSKTVPVSSGVLQRSVLSPLGSIKFSYLRHLIN